MDFSGASGNPVLREELTRLAETEGPAALHRRLQQADPKAAERILNVFFRFSSDAQ